MSSLIKKVLSCCCQQKSNVDEDAKLVESTRRDSFAPSLYSTGSLTTLKRLSSTDIPFAIPGSRKSTPTPGHFNNNSDEDEGEHYFTRSRTTTLESLYSDLGELDVSLYVGYDSDDTTTYPSNHLGRLWYTLQYDSKEEKLTVTLIKAKHLPSSRRDDCKKESTIRISLVPDEKRYMRTGVKTAETNALFNATFTFSLSLGLLEERCVRFVLFQNEPGKRAELRGQATVQLDHALVDQTGDACKNKRWVDLDYRRPSEQIVKRHQKGKILLSLQYDSHKQRIFVVVYRCIRMLYPGPSDVSVKVELVSHTNSNKKVRKKKGQVVKHCEEEVDFNELFKFSISEASLADSSVSISLKSTKSTGKYTAWNGRVVLGGMMLAAGRELEHWQLMIDQQNEEHIQWHDLC
ncbi:synaptotagmin-15-like [Watersipora subatra]|uniref:synaptotagmin-15-like n=1 Tax=Watersipora subatra TaxID=2589382 RepID=UPI00355C28DE